ncbi:MAG: cysteine-rich KTR domain-containing protein [Oscillospiraceae bacterium]|nr:cysteine-rich KTR domain-containing protein [Oscillospiraceae bacterium]
MEDKWVICPVCGSKTRVKIREDTVLKNFPLFCPKCKRESIVNAENMQVTVKSK